jgi:hypothetical protein
VSQDAGVRLQKQLRVVKDREEDMMKQIENAEQNMELVCRRRG